MTRRKQAPKDLTGIRQRGSTYQVRISGGYDPVTGRQLFLTGSADTEDAAVVLRDQLRQQVQDNTAAKTNVTLGYLLDEWLTGHQVEETTRATYRLLIDSFIRPALGDTPISRLCRLGPRPFEQLYAELRVCRRRCPGRDFVEHRTPRPHDCDERCAQHVCKPLALSTVRQCHAVLSGALRAAKRWGWITVNPLEAAQRPRMPQPQPDPPSPNEAVQMTPRPNQMRRISLDEATVEMLGAHQKCCASWCTGIGATLRDEATFSPLRTTSAHAIRTLSPSLREDDKKVWSPHTPTRAAPLQRN